jgi:hypothetical protein
MNPTAVVKRVDELLTPVGFARQTLTWNRKSGSFIDVVDIQVSKALDAVTVNVGVLDPQIYKCCWGADPPALVDEAHGTVRARIGQLVDQTDIWWPIEDPQTPQTVAEAVAEHVLQFIERMHCRRSMADFLLASNVLRQKYPPPIIYLAILKHDAGDKAGACSLLTDLQEDVRGAWRARVSELMMTLGCL